MRWCGATPPRAMFHVKQRAESVLAFHVKHFSMEGGDRLEWVQEISTLIGNLGFPIACVCILFWFQWQERKTHREETERFAAAIENNTVVMQEVKTLIETLGK